MCRPNEEQQRTIIPKIPNALPKICTTIILTKSDASCASARAQLLPAMPTQTPLAKLETPTVSPDESTAKPAKRWVSSGSQAGRLSID